MIDALAFEPQFLDHLAPVWSALPDRGRFLVPPSLVARAASRGIEADPTPLPDWHLTQPRLDGRPALVASAGDIKVGRRLGYGPFAFLEHGIGQSYGGRRDDVRHGSYAGGPDREDCGLFLVPNETCARRWRDAYPAARVEVVGSPRLDGLPHRQAWWDRPTIAISFHWPAPMSISGYAGTALGEYLPVLPALHKRFRVIGHAHPKTDWPVRMERQYQRVGIPFVRDFDEVCRQADVYVCDNSSTIFEFASTGRPVVLLNSRSWRRNVEFGLRFWEAAHVGVNVWKPDDVIPAIERALEERPEDVADREDALAIAYQPRSAGAGLAAQAVTQWARSLEGIAA